MLNIRAIEKEIAAAMATGAAKKLKDSSNLFLRIKPKGNASWCAIFVQAGLPREMGLGPYPEVGVAEARKLRDKVMVDVRNGVDPIAARKAARQPVERKPTFGELAEQLAVEKETNWKHPNSAKAWRQSVRDFCGKMNGLSVDQITVAHVVDALKQAQKRSAKGTAVRDRTRRTVEAVLSAAKALGHRSGDNPAAWAENLKHVLPQQKAAKQGHHAAMDYRELPGFIARLRHDPASAAKALEFCILTATRLSETTGARWDEIDFDAKLWTIGAERMKAGAEHRVPLSDRAIELLREQAATRTSKLVFPGRDMRTKYAPSSLRNVLIRLDGAVTVHGFRSSFKTWAEEQTSASHAAIELSLAHAVGIAVERAYSAAN